MPARRLPLRLVIIALICAIASWLFGPFVLFFGECFIRYWGGY